MIFIAYTLWNKQGKMDQLNSRFFCSIRAREHLPCCAETSSSAGIRVVKSKSRIFPFCINQDEDDDTKRAIDRNKARALHFWPRWEPDKHGLGEFTVGIMRKNLSGPEWIRDLHPLLCLGSTCCHVILHKFVLSKSCWNQILPQANQLK